MTAERTKATIDQADAELMAEHFPAMLQALQSMAIWIKHWQRDVEGGLKPTPQSLATAAEEVRAALNQGELVRAEKSS